MPSRSAVRSATWASSVLASARSCSCASRASVTSRMVPIARSGLPVHVALDRAVRGDPAHRAVGAHDAVFVGELGSRPEQAGIALVHPARSSGWIIAGALFGGQPRIVRHPDDLGGQRRPAAPLGHHIEIPGADPRALDGETQPPLAFPQRSLCPHPLDMRPGAFGHFPQQRLFGRRPAARGGVVDRHHARQAPAPDERHHDRRANADPDKGGRPVLAEFGDDVVDHERLAAPHPPNRERAERLQSIVADDRGHVGAMPVAADVEAALVRVDIGIGAVGDAEMLAQHPGGDGHHLVRIHGVGGGGAERVEKGEPRLVRARLPLRRAAIGDVDRHGEHALWRAVGPAQERDGVAHPNGRPVRAEITLLVGIGRAVRHGALDQGDVLRQIVRRGDVEQAQAQELVPPAPDDLAEPIVGADDAARHVDLRQAGRGLIEEGSQFLLALAEHRLPLLGLRHVMGDADEAAMRARLIEAGLRDRPDPAPLAIGATVAAFQGEGCERRLAGNGGGDDLRRVVGMEDRAPIEGERGLPVDPHEVDIGAVHEGPAAVEPGHPHRRGRGVGDSLEFGRGLGGRDGQAALTSRKHKETGPAWRNRPSLSRHGWKRDGVRPACRPDCRHRIRT
jgi:hypothetical protein